MVSNFYQNRHFLRQKWTEIRFWFNLNKWIIMVGSPIFSVIFDDDDRSLRKNSVLIELWSKIKSTGNFYVLGCNFNKVWWSWMCAFCVQSSSSVFSTNSVRYHTKHWYGLFRKVLPKDFTSDRPQDRIGELTSNQVLSSENLKTRTL